MKTFFNLLIPAVFIVMLPYRIWQNVQQPYPDKMAILLQAVLLAFGIGIFIYRLINLKKNWSR
jgi:hypothetical protein